MSLDHALLVSLLEKPSSGYELARRFDRSIGYFWQATHQQIYKVLARMEAAGWIVGKVERGDAAPDRTVFSATAAGRAELSGWMALPTEMEVARTAVMVKLRAAAFDDPHRLLPALHERRDGHESLLEAYRQIEQRDFSGKLDTQRALQYHVLKFGLAYQQLWIDWLQQAEALVEQLPPFDDTNRSQETK
jgi:DNA-binding PadR family transcriptional regulator